MTRVIRVIMKRKINVILGLVQFDSWNLRVIGLEGGVDPFPYWGSVLLKSYVDLKVLTYIKNKGSE